MKMKGKTPLDKPTEARIEGERIYLRPLEEKDITERYLSWFRDPEVTRFLEARDLTRQAVLDHLEEGRRSGTYFMFAICLRGNDLHVGNLKVGPMDRKHGISDLVTVIGDKGHWGRGLATEAVRLGTRLAFEVYGVRKLYGGMYAENLGSIRAYLKAGWTEEARLGDHYVSDGKVMDRVCVCAFRPGSAGKGRK